MINKLLKWWYALIALAVSFFLPADTFKDSASNIVALLGLIIAGVLPAATLTATAIRPGSLSIKKLSKYRDALSAQLSMWAVVFGCSVLSAVFVVVGQASNWSITPIDFSPVWNKKINVSFIFNSLILVSASFVFVKGASIFGGIRNILDMSFDITKDEIEERNKSQAHEVELEIKAMTPRKGYGKYVNLS